MRLYRILAVLVLAGLTTSCGSGDDPVSPEGEFRVVVEVVDTSGISVPDLNVNIASFNPYMGVNPGAKNLKGDKAITKIEYRIPAIGRLVLQIFDVEGALVRTLYDDVPPYDAGFRHWIGDDDNGVPQSSGRYTVKATLHDSDGALIAEGTKDMLMALVWKNPVGVTDSEGKIILTDRRLFPHLFNTESMQATDENGNPIGLIEIDDTMYFNMHNQAGTMSHDVIDVVSGPGKLTLVWDPKPRKVITPPGGQWSTGSLNDKEGEINLSISPNPFN